MSHTARSTSLVWASSGSSEISSTLSFRAHGFRKLSARARLKAIASTRKTVFLNGTDITRPFKITSYDYRSLHISTDRLLAALLGRCEIDHLASKLCIKVYSCSNE